MNNANERRVQLIHPKEASGAAVMRFWSLQKSRWSLNVPEWMWDDYSNPDVEGHASWPSDKVWWGELAENPVQMGVGSCRSICMEGLQDGRLVTQFLGNSMAFDCSSLSVRFGGEWTKPRRQTAFTVTTNRATESTKTNPCLFIGPPFKLFFSLIW